MAQRSKGRQPVYSADMLALRYIGGLVLTALGVMMFLAVEMNMAGNIFDALRQICYGLTGGLAAVLPVLPVWGGVLVIWSSQRKAPVKPFVYAVLAFLALCAFVVLVTRVGRDRTEFLAELAGASDGSWGGVIQRGYIRSIQLGQSGGALGVMLAYPFRSLLGTILGAALVLLLGVLCVLLAFGLTPSRIRTLASGGGFRRKEEDRAQREQQQIAFQQEQERQRQMAYAQQQAYLLQQQAAAQQSSAAWPQPEQPANSAAWPAQAGNTGMRQVWTGGTPAVTEDSVLNWQQQLTDQTVRQQRGRKSAIFSREEAPAPEEKTRSSIFDASPGQGSSRVSRIFGRKRDQEDGLSDLSEQEKRQEGMAYPASGQRRNPWPGRPGEPERADQAESGQRENTDRAGLSGTARNQRIRAEQERVEEDLNRWREPEPEEKKADPLSGQAGESWPRVPENGPEAQTAESALPNPRTDRLRKTPEKKAEEDEEGSPWTRQTSAEGKAGRKQPEEKEKQQPKASWTEEEEKPAEWQRGPEKARKPEQLQIPVAQETIQNPTWKPELKHVEEKEKPQEEEYWEPTPYYAPPITDLKKPDGNVLDTTREDEDRSRRLEATLASFKVQARVVHVTHGPVISRFELELAPGTKVNKVAELEKDIAYGMQATSVRIEAPIPGKGLVGVEVPNPQRTTVTLREVLESPQMQSAKSILTVALGKDIAGVPVVCDLARMPHMLIAGATGSGKSVCINTIINSLLFRAGPDEVKMILVDPKVVELQCYNGIPHLLLPVVNDPHKASAALAWAVAEMMERYDKFSERGVRNLEGYNAILGPGEKPMPRIVIIIDELADLMMVCKKDVEEYICRLTQLARAAGIHLIVATQRPSVDVITGLIKANIPSRIAFKTASYVDSRTILDRNGSEQLLGWGDMLYLPTGNFAPTRIQGCFLSDEEVNRIADHVRQANPSAYDPDVLDKLEQLSRGQEEGPGMDTVGGMPENGPGDANLFEQAVEFAIADGQISTSTLQRRLKVGYARAGRLTDEMEERGIVSAKDGSKPRKCLITREQWEAMRESGRGPAAEG